MHNILQPRINIIKAVFFLLDCLKCLWEILVVLNSQYLVNCKLSLWGEINWFIIFQKMLEIQTLLQNFLQIVNIASGY